MHRQFRLCFCFWGVRRLILQTEQVSGRRWRKNLKGMEFRSWTMDSLLVRLWWGFSGGWKRRCLGHSLRGSTWIHSRLVHKWNLFSHFHLLWKMMMMLLPLILKRMTSHFVHFVILRFPFCFPWFLSYNKGLF